MSSARYLAALGVVLWGCGGRARSDATTTTGGAAAIGGTATALAGANSAGGNANSGQTSLLLDDENAMGDRPTAPYSSAFFWGSQGSGWHLGNWFMTSDTVHDVELSPLDPPRNGSTEARHVSGTGFASGVVLWIELDHPLHHVVNLGDFAGLTFWARLASNSGVLGVAIDDGSHGVTPASKATLPLVSLSVGPDWQEFTVPFAELSVGKPQASSINFFVGDDGETFDLWIDDFGMVCAGACP